MRSVAHDEPTPVRLAIRGVLPPRQQPGKALKPSQNHHPPYTPMIDLYYTLAGLAFFALMILYVMACDKV